MKFMKLGSKPDIFLSDGNIRYVATELMSDIVVNVDDTKFYLHKFPLLSKSHCLQAMVAKSSDVQSDEIDLPDFPGGSIAFELCAKFCYGIVVTLNAYNVVAIRCAAEYLGMTEAMEKGNLVYKLEVFLSSSIFRSWKDSIIVLQSTKSLVPWVEDLKIVGRGIDSIATKTSVDPSQVEWSYTYTRGMLRTSKSSKEINESPCNGIHSYRPRSVPKDWWVEDLCDLDISLYQRVIMTIKSKGRMSHDIIGEALKVYTLRWLSGNSKDKEASKEENGAILFDNSDGGARQRELVETIISLLPSEKGSASCNFLLKLLKAASILGVETSTKLDLARRIGLQLHEASYKDLLIPSVSDNEDYLYDVDLVQYIIEHFQTQCQSSLGSPNKAQLNQAHENERTSSVEIMDKATIKLERQRTSSVENLEFPDDRKSISNATKIAVARVIDGYLWEVARDQNLPLLKFISTAELVSDLPRHSHDGLYRAIDIYLKEHPSLTKSERKRVCKLMDCRKLSMEASMHAAQNDRLPLRVVVQVLFFEHVRTSMAGGGVIRNDLPPSVKALLVSHENGSQGSSQSTINLDDEWDAVHDDFKNIKGEFASMKIRPSDVEREHTTVITEDGTLKNTKPRGIFLLPSRSRRIFSKFWTTKTNSENKSSETSGSSLSPISVNPVDTKSVSSRQRRHSIS